MAKAKSGLVKGDYVSAPAKKTRQGNGKNTKYTATSRNGAKKMYRSVSMPRKKDLKFGVTLVSELVTKKLA